MKNLYKSSLVKRQNPSKKVKEVLTPKETKTEREIAKEKLMKQLRN